MFCFQSLIFNLFAWLAFLSPQHEVGILATTESSYELVIATEHQQSPAIIELGSFLNEIIDSSQNIELPSANHFYKNQEAQDDSFESSLLYFQIGNAIDLKLTSTTIIFPFHCFT